MHTNFLDFRIPCHLIYADIILNETAGSDVSTENYGTIPRLSIHPEAFLQRWSLWLELQLDRAGSSVLGSTLRPKRPSQGPSHVVRFAASSSSSRTPRYRFRS